MKTARFLCCIILFVICSSTSAFSQTSYSFDFENLTLSTKIPLGLTWYGWSTKGYKVSVDSIEKHQGKYSVFIESEDSLNSGGYCAPVFHIPSIYKGKKIKLSGYIKTENVSAGFAGLMFRMDKEGSRYFNNMSDRPITKSTNWKEYSIETKFDEDFKMIHVGAVLNGKGKVWVDDLKLTIDGKLIQDAALKTLHRVDSDSEFYAGSRIKIEKLNEHQQDNLYILGKLWGFLKYYHPEIAKGNYNWDFELFRILPKIINVDDKEKRSEIFYNWIEGLGKVEICKTCSDIILNNVKMLPDLEWLNDKSKFSDKLIGQLNYIKNNRSQGEQYYIKYGNVKNADFGNEKPYNQMSFSDQGYKLLCLFRYWNMIQYFFPCKYAISDNWDKVLKEFIPKFVFSKNELDYKLAATEMVARISDTHAQFIHNDPIMNNHKGKYGAGILLKYVDDKPVVTNFFNKECEEKYNLKIGDIICKVDGRDVNTLKKERLPYVSASNEIVKLRVLAQDLLRGNTEKGIIDIIRDDKPMKVEIEREDYYSVYQKYLGSWGNTPYKFVNNRIGYIHLQSISADSIEKVMRLFKSTRGIVFDIRCYPKTNVYRELQKYILGRPVPFAKFTRPEINYPGLIKWDITMNYGQKSKDIYKGKIIILVNENTQSHAEFVTMAVRTVKGSVVIGSTTSGADGDVVQIGLPGGLQTYFSGIGVYYPDGRETQRVGIIPDIEIKPTIKGIREGRDEVLEKAVEVIEKGK